MYFAAAQHTDPGTTIFVNVICTSLLVFLGAMMRQQALDSVKHEIADKVHQWNMFCIAKQQPVSRHIDHNLADQECSNFKALLQFWRRPKRCYAKSLQLLNSLEQRYRSDPDWPSPRLGLWI